MSATIEREGEQSTAELADEVHDLEAQEEALERRTRSLELSGPLALVFSFFALAVGIGAFVVALGNRNDSGTSGGSAAVATPGSTMGSSRSSGMMMGAGGHGRFTSAQMAAARRGTVDVQLGDYWVAPAVASVRAGKVTFVAKNVGQIPHELMIERMPIKMNSPGHPNEDAAQGMIDDMEHGQSGHMTVRLKPGTYMLFCNAPGHYAAGQHMLFNVLDKT
jgi:uncharacterized cupredoxin-like copper-binding protein